MISYEPLWKTMQERNVTTYNLIYKHNFSPYTITNLKRNKSITMNTLEKLCKVLDCTADNIVEFIDDDCWVRESAWKDLSLFYIPKYIPRINYMKDHVYGRFDNSIVNYMKFRWIIFKFFEKVYTSLQLL